MKKIKYADLMKEILKQEREFLDCMVKDKDMTENEAAKRMNEYKKMLKPSRYPATSRDRIFGFMYETGYCYWDANERLLEMILE